jgi:hypothetical protein
MASGTGDFAMEPDVSHPLIEKARRAPAPIAELIGFWALGFGLWALGFGLGNALSLEPKA